MGWPALMNDQYLRAIAAASHHFKKCLKPAEPLMRTAAWPCGPSISTQVRPFDRQLDVVP